MTKQQAEYQTRVMEGARLKGCKCEYDEDAYLKNEWMHEKGCPAPLYENLPNPRILEVLRNL